MFTEGAMEKPPMVNLPQLQYDHDHDDLHKTWERYEKKGDRRQFSLSCLVHLVFSSQIEIKLYLIWTIQLNKGIV
jgi:hypothetical protein